jgi:hypothetical protein
VLGAVIGGGGGEGDAGAVTSRVAHALAAPEQPTPDVVPQQRALRPRTGPVGGGPALESPSFAVEDGVFLAAASGSVEADCAFGEPLPLLPPAPPPELSSGARDLQAEQAMTFVLLWFVLSVIAGLGDGK